MAGSCGVIHPIRWGNCLIRRIRQLTLWAHGAPFRDGRAIWFGLAFVTELLCGHVSGGAIDDENLTAITP